MTTHTDDESVVTASAPIVMNPEALARAAAHRARLAQQAWPTPGGLPYTFKDVGLLYLGPTDFSLTTHVLVPTQEHDLPHTARLGFRYLCNGDGYFTRMNDVTVRSPEDFDGFHKMCTDCAEYFAPVAPPTPPPIAKGVPIEGASRRFEMVRHRDDSGVSGVGMVCWGVVWPDGRVSTRWAQSEFGRQTSAWDCIEDVISVHGHKGGTEIRWIDPE